MTVIAIELIKKVNEKNILWFALSIIFLGLAIILFPSSFIKLTSNLEVLGIKAPYSVIAIALLYLSVGIIVMRLSLSALTGKKKSDESNNLRKKIETLAEDEAFVLFAFAIDQVTNMTIAPEWTHIARMLVTKGFLTHGYGIYYDGREDFYMSRKTLQYITNTYHDEIQTLRAEKFSNRNL